MNIERIHTEADLVYALRKTLDSSVFRMTSREPDDASGRHGLILKVAHGGRTTTFAAVCKLRLTPAVLDQVAARPKSKHHPLLITVELSESLVAHCRNRRLNGLDLNGRVCINVPGLLIDRNVPNATVRYRLAEAPLRFFSPKSARLPRALLSLPDRIWRQRDLAEITGLSQGLLSRLLNHAAKEGWVEGRRGDWKLVNREALLDAWEREDHFARRVSLKQFSTLESDPRAIARGLFERTPGDLAFTQWFAASLRHPYADVPIVTAYRSVFPTPEAQQALHFREVDDGGKVWIAIPRDDGVFRNLQHVEGLPLVCDAQIYLDLIHAGLRGPDQAKALRAWKGFCRS